MDRFQLIRDRVAAMKQETQTVGGYVNGKSDLYEYGS